MNKRPRKRINKSEGRKILQISSDLIQKEVQVTKVTDFRKKKKKTFVKTTLSDNQGEVKERESLKKEQLC